MEHKMWNMWFDADATIGCSNKCAIGIFQEK